MVEQDKKTMMRVKTSTIDKLKEIKEYPRETHEDVLLRLIKQDVEK